MNAIDLRTVSGLDRASGLDTVVMQVSPVTQGWSVTKVEGLHSSKSMINFKTKGDALCYAMSIAETEWRAVVEVYDEDGSLEARSAYWVAKNVHSGVC
ncbi:MAG: hypothetical protein ACYDBA_11470 [Sulfuricaulis sp.]